MTLTLLICCAVITLTALCMVAKPHDALVAALDEKRADVPLSDPSVETLTGNSEVPEVLRGDWHVAAVETLRDAEDLLDALEAQGVEHRELVILGNACFAVRWR